MKILITSDLHLEFADIIIKNDDDCDVLILGGDIMLAQDLHDHPEPVSTSDQRAIVNLEGMGRRQQLAQRFRDFLKRCSFQFPHVVYVAGNHEFYHGRWVQNIQDLRNECAKFSNIHFLERDCVTIDDILFIGATLWTDMNRADPLTLHAVSEMMSDFRIIRNDARGFRRLYPADTVYRHKQTLGYFREVLATNRDRHTVIVGHHAPSTLSTHPRYAEDRLMNGAYRSDLSELILDNPQIRLWTHGHTHEDFDYVIGETRIVCNPRGYVGHESRTNVWQPKLVEI